MGEKAGASNKPGSVIDNHSSGTAVTDCLKQPTRECVRNRRWQHQTPPRGRCALPYSPIWSCSGRGLPCRELLPVARCALTAPFHPYRPRSAVYFLWHFPWARTLQALPGASSEGARTFLCGPETCSDCLADMVEVFGVDRPAFIGRELTKMHEQCVRKSLASLQATAEESPGSFGQGAR